MGKLLKYEARKTVFAKLVLLIVAILLEAAFLIGFYAKKEEVIWISALFLAVAAFTGIVLFGVLSVTTLHRDMNTKQGYMLFMTPNSCYKILGAKVLECALSILLCGAFFFGMGILDMHLVLGRVGETVWNMFLSLMRSFMGDLHIDLPHIAAFVCWMISSWILTVTTAYLADVISSALLNGKRGNLLVTFVFFILLNIALSRVGQLLPEDLTAMKAFFLRAGFNLAASCVMYWITARVMDRRLSV